MELELEFWVKYDSEPFDVGLRGECLRAKADLEVGCDGGWVAVCEQQPLAFLLVEGCAVAFTPTQLSTS